ncbi:hypothetical protein GN244_ATG11087 [Phytophthora infestans]|uniref:Uncharacterized protein n=1 Tax=Phytophthora infestans TaxID=4787 RepID=A0A833W0I0_PHYIN|nr:hypothetical protein GN244_ATG11087 [Phytophthora infestans]
MADRLRARFRDSSRTSENDIRFTAQLELYSPFHQIILSNRALIEIEPLDVISSRTPSVRGSAKKAAKGQRLVKPKFDFYLVRGTDERIQRDLSRTIKLADEQGKVSDYGTLRPSFPSFTSPITVFRCVRARRISPVLYICLPNTQALVVNRRVALSRTVSPSSVSTSRSSATTGFSPLLWLGGKAAKHSTSAKSRQDAPEDLFVLLNRDSKRYERVIARTTSKFDIDED